MKPKKSVIHILSPKEHNELEQPDIFNKKGNIRFIYSFQFQLIKSALLSLLFTILTDVTLILLVFFIFFAAEKSAENATLHNNYEAACQIENSIGNAITNSGNANTSPDRYNANGADAGSLTNAISNYLDDKEPLEQHFPSAKRLIQKQQMQKMFFLLLLLVACSLALFIFYFLLLTRRLSNYLAEITFGINKIAEGDFDHPIPVKMQDELGLIAGCINEMSEQIQKNIDLERKAEQEKNQLITSVAHDIRTPLTSILGYLELLFHQPGDTDFSASQQKEYLRIAYEKSQRLMTLTEDLFTYTKVSFGELRMQPQPLDLVMFLEQMMEEFYPSFMDAGLECRFVHSAPSIRMNGDSTLLARAFSNLLSNAVKYGRDGKELLISADILAGSAVIKITNYGMLIPKEALRHIFERFYRVENSRSLDTGGSGLGLSIAQKIVLLHQGTIRASSGQDGTSFIVSLPLNADFKTNQN